MDWKVQCTAIIPCLNEAAAIGPLVEQTRSYLPSIMVVDDGSTDATSRHATQSGAQILRHALPQGKGAALQTGLRWACESGFQWALMLDGDGQHAPADIPAFFQCADATGAHLVVGNRMSDTGNMPWIRRRVNRWMSWRLSKLAGQELPDSQCGFRLVNLQSWSSLKLQTTHFEIDSELLLAFIASKYPVEFVPIQVIYKSEQSKIHPWRDTCRWFRWLRKWRRKS
jgi:glycosyltransferase involved in cell wall biosynthesis